METMSPEVKKKKLNSRNNSERKRQIATFRHIPKVLKRNVQFSSTDDRFFHRLRAKNSTRCFFTLVSARDTTNKRNNAIPASRSTKQHCKALSVVCILHSIVIHRTNEISRRKHTDRLASQGFLRRYTNSKVTRRKKQNKCHRGSKQENETSKWRDAGRKLMFRDAHAPGKQNTRVNGNKIYR